MQRETFTIASQKEPKITMDIAPGHFTTSSTHTNYYLNVSKLKHDVRIAQQVAQELAIPYKNKDIIDTIVCIEETQVLAAYLACELIEQGAYLIDEERDVNILTPISNINGQLIFQGEATEELINGKNVLLLLATVSSGKTMRRALDCLTYYGARLMGVSALFSTKSEVYGHEVHSVFSSEDIPDYQYARPAECPLCKAGEPLDAIVSAGGYMKL